VAGCGQALGLRFGEGASVAMTPMVVLPPDRIDSVLARRFGYG